MTLDQIRKIPLYGCTAPWRCDGSRITIDLTITRHHACIEKVKELLSQKVPHDLIAELIGDMMTGGNTESRCLTSQFPEIDAVKEERKRCTEILKSFDRWFESHQKWSLSTQIDGLIESIEKPDATKEGE